MKKLLIISLFSFVCFTGAKAQMIVEDPAMLSATSANWAKSLEQATQQFEQMKDQSKLLQQSIDTYKKVNGYIKNGKKVKELLEKQVQLVNFLSNEAGKSTSVAADPRLYQSYIKKIERLTIRSKDNIEQLTGLLADDKYNMTDYERMKMLDELNADSNAILSSARSEKKHFEDTSKKIATINKIMSK